MAGGHSKKLKILDGFSLVILDLTVFAVSPWMLHPILRGSLKRPSRTIGLVWAFPVILLFSRAFLKTQFYTKQLKERVQRVGNF